MYTVLAAIIAGIFALIDTIIGLKNKDLKNQVAGLIKENEELKAQIKELQQTISDREATIKELQESIESMTVHDNTNQGDSGYSDYIDWDTYTH